MNSLYIQLHTRNGMLLLKLGVRGVA